MQDIQLIIDGTVGVGKSTLMKLLKERGFQTFPEPVFDNPILDKFYEDKAKYAFALQIFFLNKRFQHSKEMASIHRAIGDRSIYGDKIFAKMLYESGDMTKEEYEIYTELLDNMLQHVKPPTLMIYLEISVEGAIKRIQKRGREFELIVEPTYWETLNRHYREFFETFDTCPVLKIPVETLDFEENENDADFVLLAIENKLRELGQDISL